MPLSDHENKIWEQLTGSLHAEPFAKKLSLTSPRFALLASITVAALIGAVATFATSTLAAGICLSVAYASAVIATTRWRERRALLHPDTHSSSPHESRWGR
jgi:hypothetical protein